MEAYDNFRIFMTVFISLVLNSMLLCVKYDPPISHSIIDFYADSYSLKSSLAYWYCTHPSITLIVYLLWIFWVWGSLAKTNSWIGIKSEIQKSANPLLFVFKIPCYAFVVVSHLTSSSECVSLGMSSWEWFMRDTIQQELHSAVVQRWDWCLDALKRKKIMFPLHGETLPFLFSCSIKQGRD